MRVFVTYGLFKSQLKSEIYNSSHLVQSMIETGTAIENCYSIEYLLLFVN
jgi:hypothetical protein